MNRAMNGDVVAIDLFPKDQWRSPGEAVVDQDGEFTFKDPTFCFSSLHHITVYIET
jgi:Rrp44-like cold shock domain